MHDKSNPSELKNSDAQKRDIRSFVIRSGRMTPSQRQALDRHLERWSLSSTPGGLYNFNAIYGNDHPVCLEIGFGMGDSMHIMASAMPETNFLGIEVHTPGVGRLLRLVEEGELNNVRVVTDDAVKILKERIAENSLSRINIFFPDPWHKTKHHKRRLIQHDFLTLLHSRLKPGGLLHVATDWVPYANHVVKCCEQSAHFEPINANSPYVLATDYGRPETKFERRGKRLQHEIRDMVFIACSIPESAN